MRDKALELFPGFVCVGTWSCHLLRWAVLVENGGWRKILSPVVGLLGLRHRRRCELDTEIGLEFGEVWAGGECREWLACGGLKKEGLMHPHPMLMCHN